MKRLVVLVGVAAATAGCWADDPLPKAPEVKTLKGQLAVDIRDTADVVLTITEGKIDASLTLSKGFGVAGGTLKGSGTVEAFPEAGTTLYTAKIDAPADPSGPCKDAPISLALSLHRRGSDAHVNGALTAYCGKSVWHGVPARLLRLGGDLL
jgi:hypothetical protein